MRIFVVSSCLPCCSLVPQRLEVFVQAEVCLVSQPVYHPLSVVML